VSNTTKLSIGTLATLLAVAACGRGRSTAANDDFSRDLQLASSSVDLPAPKVDPANLTSLETQPASAPERSTTLKKASSGNKAVRSSTPTVKAAPTQEVASTDQAQQTQTIANAPAPEPTPEPVAQAPQPTTVVVDPQGGDGDGEYGTSGNGGGIFGGGTGRGGMGGGMGGVVIRGGGVGDGDNCDPPGGIYGGRGGMRPPVYFPNPGGVGTNRIPTGRTTGTVGRSPRPTATPRRRG
jgi:hypothetical protein